MSTIKKIATAASNRSEIVAVALVFLIVVMMIIPIPAAILDYLIAFNISVSLLLVVISILLASPLNFSSFPTVLLVSTLFRLSITVSTARLILLDGFTGHIVETFGEFVVGGNVAVGVIIFLIISIVNFIVVTKGSERVAEVAARFSLDGMPGKQMSIDSDLRAGLIDQKQAKERRHTLEKETQLFGAMDGAIKFVKGDAIAGFLVVFVNLVGGLFIGMLQKDMSFAQAASRYSLLSVGDGLVALIPSLMVSIAAGVVVTRVTRNEDPAADSSAAKDMVIQLISNPKALVSAAFCVFIFGLIPGMPSVVFGAVSVGIITILVFKGNFLSDTAAFAFSSDSASTMHSVNRFAAIQDLNEVPSVKLFSVLINKNLSVPHKDLIKNVVRAARNHVIDAYGLMMPTIDFVDADIDGGKIIQCNIYEIPVATIDINLNSIYLKLNKEDEHQANGGKEFVDHINNFKYFEFDASEKNKFENDGFACESGENIVFNMIESLFIKEIRNIYSQTEFSRWMKINEERFPDVFKDLQRTLQNSKILDIVLRLISEKVSVKNFESIANTMIEWSQKERDLVIVTEHARIALKNQISHQYAYQSEIYAYVLTPESEDLIRSALRQTATGSYTILDDNSKAEISSVINSLIENEVSKPYIPVLICAADCRRYMRKFVDEKLFWLPVLSYAELSPYVKMKILGEVNFEV